MEDTYRLQSGTRIHIALATTVLLISGCSPMVSTLSVPVNANSAEVQPYVLDTYRRSIHLFDPLPVQSRAASLNLEQRINNLIVLVDKPLDSSTRDIPHKIYSREILRRLNRTLPDDVVDIYFWRVAPGNTEPLYTRTPSGLELSGQTDQLPGVGASELEEAIDRVADFSSHLEGTTGLLLITDWRNLHTGDYEAVMRFRQQGQSDEGFTVENGLNDWRSRSNGYCVFAIGVGNALSRSLFDDADYCGFSSAADKVAQPRDMAHFVEKMLYTGPSDQDGDGIYDYKDNCPATAQGRLVDSRGCPRFGNGGAS